MKPVNHNVLVKLLELATTKSDIETTTKQDERSLIAGQIIETSDQDNWKNGTKIVFGRYSIATFKYKGEEYHFLPIEDIIGTL